MLKGAVSQTSASSYMDVSCQDSSYEEFNKREITEVLGSRDKSFVYLFLGSVQSGIGKVGIFKD